MNLLKEKILFNLKEEILMEKWNKKNLDKVFNLVFNKYHLIIDF